MLRCRPAGSGCTPPTTHQRHAAELVRLDTRRQPRALEPAYVVRAVPACAYSCTLRLRTLHLPREFLAQHFSVSGHEIPVKQNRGGTQRRTLRHMPVHDPATTIPSLSLHSKYTTHAAMLDAYACMHFVGE
jgi:hypothetical protein